MTEAMFTIRNILGTEAINELVTALYCRLSVDDPNGGDEDSNSIQHQKEMLLAFCKANGYNKIRVYVDERYILGPGQKVLAVQGFTDLVLIFRPSTGGTIWGR